MNHHKPSFAFLLFGAFLCLLAMIFSGCGKSKTAEASDEDFNPNYAPVKTVSLPHNNDTYEIECSTDSVGKMKILTNRKLRKQEIVSMKTVIFVDTCNFTVTKVDMLVSEGCYQRVIFACGLDLKKLK